MKIDQTSCFLSSLVKDVAAGRTVPAAMQRPYVWHKQDVEALCDSIISGFPIGAFLLWAPGTKADLTKLAKARLGPIPAAADETGYRPFSLLLDGQNRLATLAWMMLTDTPPDLPDASEAEQATWYAGETLVLDFESRSLKFVPTAEAEVGLRMPAWTVVKQASLDRDGAKSQKTAMQLFRERIKNSWEGRFSDDEVDNFMQFWDDCGHRFREARVAITVIESATAAEARHAFIRICRVGVPMAQEDFDKAIGWDPEVAA